MQATTYLLGNTCLICNSKNLHYTFSIQTYRVEECADCGMMRLNPQPSDADLAKIYNEDYFLTGFDETKSGAHVSMLKASTAQRYLDQVERYLKKPLSGSLLEIGCGNGDLLLKAAERGLVVTGIEYSQHAVDIAAKKLGAKGQVIRGEITQLLASNMRFDFILFSEVLEHIRDPRDFLKKAYALLKEDGIAIATVPSLDSFSARCMGNKWKDFKPEHLWYFSTTTLRRLLYSENFGEIQIYTPKKTLSVDYVAEHFVRYPSQPYTTIAQLLRRCIPAFLRKRPIHIRGDGIMAVAKKTACRAVKKLSVIMTVYNEEKTLEHTLTQLLKKQSPNMSIEVIVVERRSTDNTAAILNTFSNHECIKITWQGRLHGKGKAIRAGLAEVTGDYVLIQDAGNQCDLEDYEALIAPLRSGEAAFVLGTPYGGSARKARRFSDQLLTGYCLTLGRIFFTGLVNVLFGLHLKGDPLTPYKVFRADCLKDVQLNRDRFGFALELLFKLIKKGYKPIEIPLNPYSQSFKEEKKIPVKSD